MKIYVAGPIRNRPNFNKEMFMAAATELRGQGHEVFNPIEHTMEVYGADIYDCCSDGNEHTLFEQRGFDQRRVFGDDMHYITRKADAIVLLPDWQNSKGATAEYFTGVALGLLIFKYIPGELPAPANGIEHDITDR